MSDQQQDKVIELKLTTSAVNYILAIASERPFKESALLIQMIQQQAQAPAQPPDPTPAKKK